MSEKKKAEAGVIPNPNLIFIAGAFGLYPAGGQFLNPSHISAIEPTATGAAVILHGGLEYEITHDDVSALAEFIKGQMERFNSAQAPGKKPLIEIPFLRPRG
jgi:hypothetical protein